MTFQWPFLNFVTKCVEVHIHNLNEVVIFMHNVFANTCYTKCTYTYVSIN